MYRTLCSTKDKIVFVAPDGRTYKGLKQGKGWSLYFFGTELGWVYGGKRSAQKLYEEVMN